MTFLLICRRSCRTLGGLRSESRPNPLLKPQFSMSSSKGKTSRITTWKLCLKSAIGGTSTPQSRSNLLIKSLKLGWFSSLVGRVSAPFGRVRSMKVEVAEGTTTCRWASRKSSKSKILSNLRTKACWLKEVKCGRHIWQEILWWILINRWKFLKKGHNLRKLQKLALSCLFHSLTKSKICS